MKKPNSMKIYITVIAALAVMLPLFAAGPAEAALSAEQARKTWDKVARATDLTDLPFTVKVDKTPNAWVTNGKSVTVTTGLLAILDSTSELFGVFAHESGHIKLGHYHKTVNRHTGLSIAASVLSNILGGGLGSAAVGVGANLAAAGWSREQEVEADDYAVKLSHETGEDIVGLYSALIKLSSHAGKLEPSGFHSHPPDDRRLLHIRQEVMKYDPDAKFPPRPKKDK